jgi:23S rRNA (guanosine2251-2'-O)-methyltransferase
MAQLTKSPYIAGKNNVLEALQSDRDIAKIFISFTSGGANVDSIYRLAKEKGVPVVKHDKRKFQELEKKADAVGRSQGIIAFVEPITTYSLDYLIKDSLAREKKPVFVLLDEIEDVHNLGAIARSAECSGAMGIIIPERNAAPITPAAIRISAGALNHIKVAKVGNTLNAIKKLKDSGFWVYGAEGTAEKHYTDNIYDNPVCLVVGSEDKGIRPVVRKECDFLIKIPMAGKTESLNASVAGGIILFEILKQRSEANA